jgi:predicted Zn-dependent peptidase
MSQFVKDIQDSQVEPIQPKFVDYKTDFSSLQMKKGMPLYYVKNTTNGLFNLAYRYEFGQSADKRYDIAADYIQYLGTDRMTATDIKQKFYELGCDWSINVGEENLTVSLSGLSENMTQAMTLLDDLFMNAKADKEAYDQLVDMTMKKRDDAKKSQQSYFAYLYAYGTQGAHNAYRDLVTEQELKSTNPQAFIDLLKNLSQYEHSVLYYGPVDEKTVADNVKKLHSTAKQLASVPQNNPYLDQRADKNEVLLAPYDAKNIYMRMYHNEGRDWNPDEAAIRALFNEYFGGGMNGIVFQEMRETRGLAYNAYAFYSRPSVKGRKESFMTHIITQNDKMMDCINHYNEILNEMPASENGFNIAKDALTKQLASMRTTKMSIIYSYLNAKRLGIDYDLNGKIYQDLSKVTLKDIVDYEKNLMANKQYRYIILGDENNLDMDALEKIAPVKRLTTEEVFGY